MASWIHLLPGRDPWLLSLLTAVAMIILPASFNACSDSGTEPDIIDDQHIRETTLRFMTELHWDSHYAFVTFASAEGTPRDSSLGKFSPLPAASYQRLDDITHPMRPFEECTLHLGGVSHPDFEQRGICIWAGDVTRIGANEVVVYGGYYVGGLGAAGYLVRLEKKKGVWEVVDFDMMWIS
jgi:hypothetical protein